MDPKHREILDMYCEELISEINLRKLWPKLFEFKIYNTDDVNINRWLKNLNNQDTAKDIYLTIKTRGPNAFENFIISLRQSEHETTAEKLENINSTYSNNNTRLVIARRVPVLNHVENQESSSNLEDNFHHQIQISNQPLQIQVRRATEFLDIPTQENIQKYPMRSTPRGLVLIINNIHFEYSNEGPRLSAEFDEVNLKELFEQMGFEVIVYRDLLTKDLDEKVKAFSQHPDLRKVDSCFVIVMSHGAQTGDHGDTEIQGTDYHPTLQKDNPNHKKILCTDIVNYFTTSACPFLEKKPKVFIFQLCRGEKRQKAVRGYRHTTDSSTIPELYTNNISPYINTFRTYTDILIAHSTVPGYVSFRDKITGSWFIQILCEVFMRYACEYHVFDLLNMVDNRLESQRTMEDECQTLALTSLGFSKHCYLNPGLF